MARPAISDLARRCNVLASRQSPQAATQLGRSGPSSGFRRSSRRCRIGKPLPDSKPFPIWCASRGVDWLPATAATVIRFVRSVRRTRNRRRSVSGSTKYRSASGRLGACHKRSRRAAPRSTPRGGRGAVAEVTRALSRRLHRVIPITGCTPDPYATPGESDGQSATSKNEPSR
jgi:hypothetical protein